MKKKKSLHLVLVGIVLAFCYVLIEGGVRIIDATYPFGILGVKTGLENMKKRAAETNRDWQTLALDTQASGFPGRAHLMQSGERLHWRAGTRTRILLFGNSVSIGNYLGQKKPYPADVDERLKAEWGQLINLAVDGSGIDEMVVKALQANALYEPDIVVIAYIAHNLLRTGSTFLYDFPKLKFKPAGRAVNLQKAEGISGFYQRYIDADRSGTLSLWALGLLWSNREYILPQFHEVYYKGVYAELMDLIDRSAGAVGARVIFLRLTNFTEFRGRVELTRIAERAFSQIPENSSVVGHFDTDECTKRETERRGLGWEKTFIFHPDRVGHEILGICVSQLLQEVI